MKSYLKFAIVLAPLVFGGCAVAPQQTVQLDKSTLVSQTSAVGVAMTALPKVDTDFPGAGCLLCMAAASVANNSLTTYTRTLPSDDIAAFKNQMADALRAKGVKVTVIDDSIDLDKLQSYSGSGSSLAKKDFSLFKAKYNIDKLVVIDVHTLGMQRTYSAYIPTSDPKAVLDGTGYMVNLSTNTYEWYLPVNIQKSSDGAWDEPPSYPGLTNAYYQAIEQGKDSFLKPFAN